MRRPPASRSGVVAPRQPALPPAAVEPPPGAAMEPPELPAAEPSVPPAADLPPAADPSPAADLAPEHPGAPGWRRGLRGVLPSDLKREATALAVLAGPVVSGATRGRGLLQWPPPARPW